jgi:hypothetical protein
MAATWPKGALERWRHLLDQCRMDERFNMSLEPEVQTDKHLIKISACQFCGRPLVVSTFYVDAWLKCSSCAGTTGSRERGSVEVVQSGGRTEPKLAADLIKCLINHHFAHAVCPAHPDDDTHVMELKYVNHNEHYGPHEWRKIDNTMVPVQIAPGETVLHQCLKCLAIVTYTTTAVTQYARINEVRPGKHANGMTDFLGTRDDGLETWQDKVDDFEEVVE